MGDISGAVASCSSSKHWNHNSSYKRFAIPAMVILYLFIAICVVYREHHKVLCIHTPTPVAGTDEITRTHQNVHLQRVVTEDEVETDPAEQDGHVQFQ